MTLRHTSHSGPIAGLAEDRLQVLFHRLDIRGALLRKRRRSRCAETTKMRGARPKGRRRAPAPQAATGKDTPLYLGPKLESGLHVVELSNLNGRTHWYESLWRLHGRGYIAEEALFDSPTRLLRIVWVE